MFKAHESVGFPYILSKHLQKMDRFGFSPADKMDSCHDIINNIMAEQAATKGVVPRGKLYNIVKDATPEMEDTEKIAV